MKVAPLGLFGALCATLLCSCAPSHLRYKYDSRYHKYYPIHFVQETKPSFKCTHHHDHPIYFSSNPQKRRKLGDRNPDDFHNPARANPYVQVINLCPQGHQIDVTGFLSGDSIRCPIDNSIFNVQEDCRTKKALNLPK